MKALGNIRLRLHHSISFKYKEVLVAGTLWEKLKDSYGNPGILSIYAEFKQAIETKIPDNADPSLTIDKLAAHFGRLAENGVVIEDHLQGMMLLSKLSPSMEAIAQLMCQEHDIKKITILVVRRAILMGWEQRSGAKGQPRQNAQKLSTVKRGPNEPPFQQQQQQSQQQQGEGSGAQGKRNRQVNRSG